MLNHDLIRPDGEPRAWVMFLHGIYGAGRNWNTVARRVARERQGTGAVTADLREHGASMGMAPPHTIEAAARDVVQLIESLDAPVAALAGHSFGGKVTLMVGRLMAERAPAELWVVDSTPESREPSGSAWQMLEVLRQAPGPFAERGEAIARLEELGVANPVAQWISTNLDRGDPGLTWRLDLDVMEALLLDFFRTDLWDVVEQPPGETTVHIVKASESSVLSPAAVERIRTAEAAGARVRFHEVEGGHWLNADNPDALVRLMGETG